jgi:hypothetical protein
VKQLKACCLESLFACDLEEWSAFGASPQSGLVGVRVDKATGPADDYAAVSGSSNAMTANEEKIESPCRAGSWLGEFSGEFYFIP